ncbi:DUF2802 domain-containing protein [Luteibacter aegosomatissinici]|uniref:DUF2802 domain-containing protein n=1 Tax=Luteibacter aegosomatissinici TaxID=2911539 RepID=UPI001FFA3A8B|nr:DUF2802 domain-containing protein [Luteibacter aegosomatissinici]UPG93465.1 DUF2802 domain-containing protein [Luteibacter aegosomatissinici]
MNAAIIGYVLIALAVINLIGLLFLFRRLGNQAPMKPVPIAVEPSTTLEPTPVPVIPAIEPDQLASMLRRLENRLGDIEDQVRRQPTVTVASESGGASDRSLALAQRLARQGASPQDIADTCGISLTEAELLHRLHSAR